MSKKKQFKSMLCMFMTFLMVFTSVDSGIIGMKTVFAEVAKEDNAVVKAENKTIENENQKKDDMSSKVEDKKEVVDPDKKKNIEKPILNEEKKDTTEEKVKVENTDNKENIPVVVNTEKDETVVHNSEQTNPEIKDMEKPNIEVTGIKDGQEVTTEEVSFKVIVTDNNVDKDIKTVVKLNGQAITATNGEYKVTLKEGDNIITIEATDAAGNKADKSYKIIYKQEEAVANPTIKSINPAANVEVEYGAIKDNAIEKLAKTTTIKDSNDKEHTVNLICTIENYDGNKAGEYTAVGNFALPAGVDQAAEEMELKVTTKLIVLEENKHTEKPVIKVEGLEDKQEVNTKEITFKVKVTDNVDKDIKEVVKLNGEVITATNGEYKVTLKDGENTITIEATDAVGNKSNEDYKIVLKKEFITDSTSKPNIRLKGFRNEDKVDKTELKFNITFKHITDEPTVKLNNEVISGKVLAHKKDLYEVEYVVGLNEGKNILDINAININVANENNRKVIKQYVINKVKDATPPVIETDLKDDMLVQDKEFIFHVKAIDNIDGEVGVKVTLNDKEIEGVNGEYKVILENLTNYIKIKAMDSSKNVANDNNYFTIKRKDKEPPTIETNLEDEQRVINDEIILNVNANDNSGYVETTVKVNGEELSESEKRYNVKLKDGENLICIEAVDKEGNKTTKQYKIIKVDKLQDKEAPNLKLEGLKDGQKLKTSKLSFKVKVIDNLDVNVKEIVKLNGEIVIGTNGEYKLILKDGENTINIEATDIAGNKTDKIYKVTYDISFIKSIKVTNKFDKIITGNEIELEVLDQDNEKIDADELNLSVDNEEKGKIINNEENFKFKALGVGNISLTAALKKNSSVKTTINFNIRLNKKKVYMRIEGYDHTILPRTEMEVPLYNLSKDLGKADGSSASDSSGWGPERFSEPTNAHAIVYALKNYCNMHSQDRSKEKDEKDNFNLQDYGWSLYIAMIGGDREFDHGQMSGWMYRVNDDLLPVGCQGADLRDGDEILWYYGAFGFDNIYTKLEYDKNKIKPGEQVELHAKGYKGGYVNEEIDLENATILVNGKEYEENGKVVKTDEKGNVTIKLNNVGKYEISLVSFRPGNGKVTGTQQIDTVRPIPVIIEVSTNTEPEIPEDKDTEAPKIEVTGLTSGQEVKDAELSFKVTVTDNVNKNIKPVVKLNDEVITETNGEYKVTLKDGENTITIEATDVAGNKSDKTYKITYKTNTTDPGIPEVPETDTEAPKIEVIGITNGQEVTTEEVNFKVTVTDNVDGNIKAVVKLNGEVITETNGDYKVKLKDGENTITVEAKDAAGNKSDVTYKITYKKGELTLEDKVNESIEKVHNYIIKNSTYSSDWKTVAFNKSGLKLLENYNSDYLNKTAKLIKDSNGYFYKVTDYERITLGVVAAGGDPRNIGGYNLLDKIYNFNDPENPNNGLNFQGLNGVIYGLIALDSKRYEIPDGAKYTREYMLDYVLDHRNSDGGWDLNMNGSNSDVDITSMTLISLAPYHDYVSKSGESVKDAVNEASSWLSKVQKKDGGFNSWFTENNSESCSQTIIGLSVHGIDPTSLKFTKDRNLVENLLRFQQPSGEFYHLMDGSEGVNGMSTEQAYQALLSYREFVNSGRTYNKGKNSIYYFGESDNGNPGNEPGPGEEEDTEAPKISTDLTDGKEVTTKELSFKVEATDNVDKDIVPVVKLDGKVITGTKGEYKVELKDGENIIEIEAVDKAGNKANAVYKVIKTEEKEDTEAPKIEVTGLTNGVEVTNPELSFKVEVTDNVDKDIVPVVKLNGEIVTGTNGEYKVKLKDGENTITIEAIDKAGNKVSISYPVKYKVIEIKPIEEIKIEKGMKNDVKVTVENISEKDKEVTLALVLYEKNTNEMMGYKFVKKLVKVGENGELKGQIEVPQEGDYLVKVIFCDDLSPEKMNVLTDPILVEVK